MDSSGILLDANVIVYIIRLNNIEGYSEALLVNLQRFYAAMVHVGGRGAVLLPMYSVRTGMDWGRAEIFPA